MQFLLHNDIYKCDFGTGICNKEISLSHITWQKKDWDKILVWHFFYNLFFIPTMYTEDFARKKRLTYLGGCLRYYDCSIFNYMHTNVSRCFQLSLFRFSIVCLVYMLSANLRISMFNIADTTKTGAAEQVKPVKPGLHRNSEVLVQRNF